MNVEATLLPQMVDHTVRVFDPMLDEAAQVDHIPPRAGDTGLIGSEARSGRPDLLDLDYFSDQIMPEPVRQPPPEVVVANYSAAVEAAASVELEPVLFDVQDSSGCEFQSTIANLRNRGSPASAANLTAAKEVAPTATGIHYPAQRKVGKEVAASRHEARGPSTKCHDEEAGITSDTRPPDASSFQQFTATFSSTLTPAHCEALDALLPAGMGSLATEAAASLLVA